MAEPIFEQNIHVRGYEVDFRGRIRITALLNYLQEAAGDHARLLGVAVRDLMPQGLTWVLSRTHLICTGNLHPRYDFILRTWPSSREGRFTCREFEIYDSDGVRVVSATCSFAVLDLETRRPIVIGRRLPEYPLLQRRAIDDSFPTLPRLDYPESEVGFRVGAGDMDVNAHANNVAYVNWALEAVPFEVVELHRLVDLEVAYRAEVFYGQTVVSLSRELPGFPVRTFLHQLIRKEDNAELTRLISRWERV